MEKAIGEFPISRRLMMDYRCAVVDGAGLQKLGESVRQYLYSDLSALVYQSPNLFPSIHLALQKI